MKKLFLLLLSSVVALLFTSYLSMAQSSNKLKQQLRKEANQLLDHTIELRRDFHMHAELSNREFRTAKKIASYLKDLGLTVQTNVAGTGVVAILKGKRSKPVLAYRADIDALPIAESNDLPFVCKTKGKFNGKEVPIMHACGHDTHIAILLTTAKILTAHKNELNGTIKFIFQPAEEGPPVGEEGGAELMIKEGVLEKPSVDAIVGLHINAQLETGRISYRPKGTMAAVNDFRIIVKGKPSHGGYPWNSVDPILTSAYIINALQSIVSRNVKLIENAAVVTVGSIHGGVRSNVIPADVEMLGTIRTLSVEDELMVNERFKTIVNNVAASMGAEVDVKVPYSARYPVTFNNVKLTEELLPSLQEVAGKENVQLREAVTGAEDFSFFAEKVPGFYFFLGGRPKHISEEESAPHHTPQFFLEEKGLSLGVKAFCTIAVDYFSHR